MLDADVGVVKSSATSGNNCQCGLSDIQEKRKSFEAYVVSFFLYISGII